MRDERFKYVPTSLLYFFYQGPAVYGADSNGCAAGNTLEEAVVQGFLELMERDAYAIWWYNRLQVPEVDLSQFDDPYVDDLRNAFAENGRRLWVLDVTSDFGIPSFVAITHWQDNGRENIEFGSGAHFDPRIALLRALTELNQFLAIGLTGARKRNKAGLGGVTPLRLSEHGFLLPSGKSTLRSDAGARFAPLDLREQMDACVRLVARQRLDFLVLDQTRPDIGVPVVRVIVPGLRHFYRASRRVGFTTFRSSSDCGTLPCPKPSSIRFSRRLKVSVLAVRAPRPKKRPKRRAAKRFRPARRSRHTRS